MGHHDFQSHEGHMECLSRAALHEEVCPTQLPSAPLLCPCSPSQAVWLPHAKQPDTCINISSPVLISVLLLHRRPFPSFCKAFSNPLLGKERRQKVGKKDRAKPKVQHRAQGTGRATGCCPDHQSLREARIQIWRRESKDSHSWQDQHRGEAEVAGDREAKK